MAKKPATAQQKPSLELFQEEIRKRAEAIYHQRTAAGKPGDDLSDWLEAEQEIKKKYKLS